MIDLSAEVVDAQVEILTSKATLDEKAVRLAKLRGVRVRDAREYLLRAAGVGDVIVHSNPVDPAPQRLTGQEIFDAKTKAQQDEMVGPEAAELIRNGDITIHDLYSHSRLENRPDYLTQKPLKDVSGFGTLGK